MLLICFCRTFTATAILQTTCRCSSHHRICRMDLILSSQQLLHPQVINLSVVKHLSSTTLYSSKPTIKRDKYTQIPQRQPRICLQDKTSSPPTPTTSGSSSSTSRIQRSKLQQTASNCNSHTAQRTIHMKRQWAISTAVK